MDASKLTPTASAWPHAPPIAPLPPCTGSKLPPSTCSQTTTPEQTHPSNDATIPPRGPREPLPTPLEHPRVKIRRIRSAPSLDSHFVPPLDHLPSTAYTPAPTRPPSRRTTMPIGTNVPRQAPTPNAQTPSSNLASQPAQSNGLPNGLLPNGVPHAGHQTDINYLWGIVQELSDVLQQNRAQTAGLVEQVRQMQLREQHSPPPLPPPPPPPPNGTSADDDDDNNNNNNNPQPNGAQQPSQIELASLRSELHSARTQSAALSDELHTQCNINDDYVTFLNSIMAKLRTYAHAHSNAIVDIHKHYNRLLDEERTTNLQLRLEHGEWQAGLGRAAEWARRALRERSEETNGMERRMREVRAENRVLRSLLGWEVPAEEEESEDEGPAGGGGGGSRVEGGSEVSSNRGEGVQGRRRGGLRGSRGGAAATGGGVGGGGGATVGAGGQSLS